MKQQCVVLSKGNIANDRTYQPTTTPNNKGFWTFDLLQAVLAYNMQIFGLFGLCSLFTYVSPVFIPMMTPCINFTDIYISDGSDT